MAITLRATAICASRDADAGFPVPPLARQVDGVNCSPPEKPLPVLVAQFPPDSHAAMASQLTSVIAEAGMAGIVAADSATAPAAAYCGTLLGGAGAR